MRKIRLFVLLSLVFFATVGMGGLGGSSRVNIPEPGRNYTATIVDQSDVSSNVEKLSFEGQTAISGKMGSGDVSIGFDKIISINFLLEGDVLKASVLLQDGRTISLVVDKATHCYGKLPYGDFKIAVRGIKSIKVHNPAGSQ